VLSLDNLCVKELPPQLTGMRPVGWTSDGRGVLLSTAQDPPWKLVRADVESGSTRELATFAPQDSTGRLWMSGIVATPDGGSWVYSWARNVSQLYEADGWLNGPERP
jgi:hypothetical protein